MINYPEKDANEIIPNLWLGNVHVANDKYFINKYNINHILTIMDDFDNYGQTNNNIPHYIISLKDIDTCSKDMTSIFDNATLLIYNALKRNEHILIHCKRGHHRSATVVAAFMMKYMHTNYIATIKYINYIRPNALRRDTCISKHLFKYYLHLHNVNYNDNDIVCTINDGLHRCKLK